MRPRFLSLDVFRGATVALMILVNNPGSWSHLYPPLAHATWHGWTPTDLVFPFFLFAVGNALAFVLPGLEAGPSSALWGRILRRTALIFLVGLLLNYSPFVYWTKADDLAVKSLEHLRILGVLQRIALAYGAAAVIAHLAGRRGSFWAAALLLSAYWGACLAFGDPADPYSLEGFFGTGLDRALLGSAHLYHGEGVAFDPEGLASTIPAVAQVLIGYVAGETIARLQPSPELVSRLSVAAAGLLAGGYAWGLLMPINKKIWTSSYVLHTSGLALLTLAVLIYLLDLRQVRGAWVSFCTAFGRNPLFVFVLSGLVPRFAALIRWPAGTAADGSTLWESPLPWIQKHVFADIGPDPRFGSLLYAIATVACYWLLAWWLDRRKIYLRL